jgi:hypothetical protein
MRSIIIRSLIVPAAVGLLAVPALANNVWINEIHYDNSGTDAGEFIEVVIGPGGPAASRRGWASASIRSTPRCRI